MKLLEIIKPFVFKRTNEVKIIKIYYIYLLYYEYKIYKKFTILSFISFYFKTDTFDSLTKSSINQYNSILMNGELTIKEIYKIKN